jgi:hypothetical protein
MSFAIKTKVSMEIRLMAKGNKLVSSQLVCFLETGALEDAINLNDGVNINSSTGTSKQIKQLLSFKHSSALKKAGNDSTLGKTQTGLLGYFRLEVFIAKP